MWCRHRVFPMDTRAQGSDAGQGAWGRGAEQAQSQHTQPVAVPRCALRRDFGRNLANPDLRPLDLSPGPGLAERAWSSESVRAQRCPSVAGTRALQKLGKWHSFLPPHWALGTEGLSKNWDDLMKFAKDNDGTKLMC